MLVALRARSGAETLPLTPLTKARLNGFLSDCPPEVAARVTSTAFTAEPGQVCLISGVDGRLAGVLAGVSAIDDHKAYIGLPTLLPPGSYRLDAELSPVAADRAALGWALGSYTFTRYRKAEKTLPILVWPKGANRPNIERAAGAAYYVRDLINTPAGDMGPAELAESARILAEEFEAKLKLTVGAELLAQNYPAIHAVGRASPREPRLIDLSWGRRSDPKVTLVGKGVCFDTGGLDLKSSSTMLLMKKDMGGAAHVLGLARMIMMAGLPVRLRVLIPAVDNAVSGDALRPLDVIATRKGLSVEIGNTDAEGRLVLADALAEADRDKPEILIDFATLTGAARVALGPELPALFCNCDTLATELLKAAEETADPMWRLPLWQPYRSGLDSKVADLNNVASHGHAGAILAGLFLERFVSAETPWVHLDIMAWNGSAKPGRPEGGEAMGLRAVYALIEHRFGVGKTPG
ncbi:MAG: leucyl aminopeptidase family protein [Rhodospirillaceae bacterium]